jgi:hypothetical protein
MRLSIFRPALQYERLQSERVRIIPASGTQRSRDCRRDTSADATVRHHLHEHQYREDQGDTGERIRAKKAHEIRLRYANEGLHTSTMTVGQASLSMVERIGPFSVARCPPPSETAAVPASEVCGRFLAPARAAPSAPPGLSGFPAARCSFERKGCYSGTRQLDPPPSDLHRAERTR